MDSRITKLRKRLETQKRKIIELQAQVIETEGEIKKAEEEQLGYLARSAANTLSGGMDEVFELLLSLRNKNTTASSVGTEKTQNDEQEEIEIDTTKTDAQGNGGSAN